MKICTNKNNVYIFVNDNYNNWIKIFSYDEKLIKDIHIRKTVQSSKLTNEFEIYSDFIFVFLIVMIIISQVLNI